MYRNRWSIGFIRFFFLVCFLCLFRIWAIANSYYSGLESTAPTNWNSLPLNFSSVKWLMFPLFISVTYYNGYVFVTRKMKGINLKNILNVIGVFSVGIVVNIIISFIFLVFLYIFIQLFKLVFLFLKTIISFI